MSTTGLEWYDALFSSTPALPASLVQPGAQDVANSMIADGYNSVVVNNLVQSGATAAQLQGLYDTYGPADFLAPASDLQNNLVGTNTPGAGAVLNAAGGAAAAVAASPIGALVAPTIHSAIAPPSTSTTNWALIIGVIAVLAIGFIFVFL